MASAGGDVCGRPYAGRMSIPARLSIVTLGVADVAASAAFYQALGWQRAAASIDEIVWFQTSGSAIGLFERGELAADAAIANTPSSPYQGFTLAINLESIEAVDAALQVAIAAGATVTKQPTTAEWGGYSGYFADPDGFLWELAFNPTFAIGNDGRLEL